MTAEIAILNTSAVALAADSAVTVGNKKVYNSANKLFALSKFEPVGIMVYGDAQFLSTPWEVVIKYYRREILDRKKFDTLEEYAEDFIKFLRTGPIFSEQSEIAYLMGVFEVTLENVVEAIEKDIRLLFENNEKVSESLIKRVVKKRISDECDSLNAYPYVENANDKISISLTKSIKDLDEFNSLVQEKFQKIPLSKIQVNQLRKLCVGNLLRLVFKVGYSGVVIAGFGKNDIFPKIESYEVEGRFNNYLKAGRNLGKCERVDAISNPASILAFAQSEMVNVFMEGVHPEIRRVNNYYFKGLQKELPQILLKRFNLPITAQNIEGLRSDIDDMANKFEELHTTITQKHFINPIVNTVASLPKDELAAMAEALVNLTSFKRKVTMVTETVGGPVDVAVISKGDGLIWIKRKHYFDRNLNHHFLENYFRRDEDE